MLQQVPVLLPFLLVFLIFLFISRPCNLFFFSVTGLVFKMLNFFLLLYSIRTFSVEDRHANLVAKWIEKTFQWAKRDECDWTCHSVDSWSFVQFAHYKLIQTRAIFMKMRNFLLEFSVWILQPRKDTRQLIFVHPMCQITIFLWFTTSFVQWRDQDVDNWSLPFIFSAELLSHNFGAPFPCSADFAGDVPYLSVEVPKPKASISNAMQSSFTVYLHKHTSLFRPINSAVTAIIFNPFDTSNIGRGRIEPRTSDVKINWATSPPTPWLIKVPVTIWEANFPTQKGKTSHSQGGVETNIIIWTVFYRDKE